MYKTSIFYILRIYTGPKNILSISYLIPRYLENITICRTWNDPWMSLQYFGHILLIYLECPGYICRICWRWHKIPISVVYLKNILKYPLNIIRISTLWIWTSRIFTDWISNFRFHWFISAKIFFTDKSVNFHWLNQWKKYFYC